MKQIKLIISTVAVLTAAMPGANAAVCMANNTAPTSCTGYTQAYAANAGDTVQMTGSWAVWGCTGGGDIKRFAGISYCSNANGTYAQQGDPGNTKGKYCWCMLTNPAASAWVFRSDVGSAVACSQYCAHYCAGSAQNPSAFRSALFDAIGQLFFVFFLFHVK
jgi:hypothetical protein